MLGVYADSEKQQQQQQQRLSQKLVVGSSPRLREVFPEKNSIDPRHSGWSVGELEKVIWSGFNVRRE